MTLSEISEKKREKDGMSGRCQEAPRTAPHRTNIYERERERKRDKETQGSPIRCQSATLNYQAFVLSGLVVYESPH